MVHLYEKGASFSENLNGLFSRPPDRIGSDLFSDFSSLVDRTIYITDGSFGVLLRPRNLFEQPRGSFGLLHCLQRNPAAVVRSGAGCAVAGHYRNQLWNRTFLDQVVSGHTDGRKNYVREINSVLTLEGIERLLFRHSVETKRSPERIDTGRCHRS